jgi:hypothetical protein
MKFPRRFLEKVFGDALERYGLDIEVRCLGKRHDKDPMWPEQFWFESLDDFEKEWVEIEDRNSSGFDIHFTIMPRFRKFHGKKEHPLPDKPVACCVWADLDVGEGKPYKTTAEALRHVRDLKPWPNIIVWSGSGIHVYYFLVEPRRVQKERFERLLHALASRLHGDTAAARATRLMRLPNTYNWKRGGNGKLAKARFLLKTRHRLRDLEERWSANSDDTARHDVVQTTRHLNLFADNLDSFHRSRGSVEATARCPFHSDKHPSFAVNVNTGLWHCRAESCRAKGNAEQFCDRLQISLPSEFRDRLTGSPLHSGRKLAHPRLSEDALYGLAGDIVRAIEPETESDPAAILVQLLVAFGNCIGPRPHFEIEATKHRANLFSLIVGRSSKSRKGTSWAHVKRLFSRVDRRWCDEQIATGLSSGEGLIWIARDPEKPKQGSGKAKGDSGFVTTVDKRFMVLQSEFSRVLRVQRREGNTLSSVLRSAWDSETLSILTKNAPAKATGAHVSIIGHITQDELRRELRATDEANGYANRFLFVYAERSQCLPFGGRVDEQTMFELAKRLIRARQFARSVDQMKFSKKARTLWRKVYVRLSRETPAMLGAITSRAEAQALRLSIVYALLDCSDVIKTQHLKAAVALWDYCEGSAAFIFGASLGDPIADKILRELQSNPKGLTRDDIRELFHHNSHKHEIDEALALLANSGLAGSRREQTEGRSAKRWIAV